MVMEAHTTIGVLVGNEDVRAHLINKKATRPKNPKSMRMLMT